VKAKVIAVVLNWNGLEDTLACLQSLSALDYEALETIVVDNGSRVSPRAAVSESHPQVEVIENDVNLGYAAGNNVGIGRALERGAEFVWILNNDLTVEPDSLDLLLQTARAHPRAAALGGKVLLAGSADRLWLAWGRVSWRQSLIELVGEGRQDDGSFDGEASVPWIPGCALLLRAEALREVGAFDAEYFAYHEDVDWAERARRSGWQSWFNGASRVHHAVHGSSGGAAHYGGFRKYLSARNSVLYARRYGRSYQLAFFAAAILLTLPFQFARRLASGEQEGVYKKVQGWRDALLGRPIPFEKLGLR